VLLADKDTNNNVVEKKRGKRMKSEADTEKLALKNVPADTAKVVFVKVK